MAVKAWFSDETVDIDPGTALNLKLSIQNLGDTTETYTIVPAGLTADWVKTDRSHLTLFGGATEVIGIDVAPPRLATTTAGLTSIGVRIIPTDQPDDTIVAETTLDVKPFDDRRIVVLSPLIKSRRRANFEFMVENHGNGFASARLRLIDPSERLDGDFDPPAVGIAPDGSSLVRLKARAKRTAFRRNDRTLDFEVEAEQQGHDPAAAPMALVQPRTVPVDLISKAAGVAAALGLAALGWFHVVKPEIQDAAATEVRDRLAEFETRIEASNGGDPQDPTTSTVVENVGPSVEAGEPTEIRLESTPEQAETVDAAYTVPDGQVFDLTDIRVENSNGDTGRATLLVNGEVRYVWALANIRGSVFEPSLTPTRYAAGDNLTFSVNCDSFGDTDLGTCLVAVNLGGRTLPVDEL